MADSPIVFIEGIEEVTKRDLARNKEIVARTKEEVRVYRQARAHEIKRRKHYKALIGGGKYNDDSLRASMKEIAINIRHMSDRVKAAEEKLAFHQKIVDTLFKQLVEHDESMRLLKRIRDAARN